MSFKEKNNAITNLISLIIQKTGGENTEQLSNFLESQQISNPIYEDATGENLQQQIADLLDHRFQINPNFDVESAKQKIPDVTNFNNLAESGSLVVEHLSTNSFKETILLESGTQVSGHDNLAIESSLTQDDNIADGFLLEDGTGEDAGDVIILNGTDSSSSDAGFKLLAQINEDEILQNPRVFLMESSDIFPSVGSIPLSNFTLNSTSSGYDPVTHSSVITTRRTGDIALEDGTDTEDSSNGFLLEETNGDNIDLEGATGINP